MGADETRDGGEDLADLDLIGGGQFRLGVGDDDVHRGGGVESDLAVHGFLAVGFDHIVLTRGNGCDEGLAGAAAGDADDHGRGDGLDRDVFGEDVGIVRLQEGKGLELGGRGVFRLRFRLGFVASEHCNGCKGSENQSVKFHDTDIYG